VLSLRRDHPCSACFLDETGAISRDRYFAVGLVKLAEPARLIRALTKLRDQKHWYREIHFTDLRPNRVSLYQEVVDVSFASGLEFWCFVADRTAADPIGRFGTPWDAYGRLAEQLVVASIHPGELVSIMADNYSTPDHIQFEEQLKSNVNRRLNRLSVVTACRLDSKSCDGLQVADLLTSAVAHEFRASTGGASHTSPKGQLAAYVRKGLGCGSCLNGWRNDRHSVQIYGQGKGPTGAVSV
jgi:hypothetical protein